MKKILIDYGFIRELILEEDEEGFVHAREGDIETEVFTYRIEDFNPDKDMDTLLTEDMKLCGDDCMDTYTVTSSDNDTKNASYNWKKGGNNYFTTISYANNGSWCYKTAVVPVGIIYDRDMADDPMYIASNMISDTYNEWGIDTNTPETDIPTEYVLLKQLEKEEFTGCKEVESSIPTWVIKGPVYALDDYDKITIVISKENNLWRLAASFYNPERKEQTRIYKLFEENTGD